MSSQGQGGWGQKLPILLSKKTTKSGGEGQKLLILRRHSLWTAPYVDLTNVYYVKSEWVISSNFVAILEYVDIK
jgi:hypothetical protein